jgi:hypothetical protein
MSSKASEQFDFIKYLGGAISSDGLGTKEHSMRISKPATALLYIAAIAALASASLSKTVPADREPSPSDVASAKASLPDSGFVRAWTTNEIGQLQLGRGPNNTPLPAALGLNDDAAPPKYALREHQARE